MLKIVAVFGISGCSTAIPLKSIQNYSTLHLFVTEFVRTEGSFIIFKPVIIMFPTYENKRFVTIEHDPPRLTNQNSINDNLSQFSLL